MRRTLSVAIISLNEEANLARTLTSIDWADEIVIVDSGSTDATAEIAAQHRVRFYTEPWKGFAAQKNSAIAKCTGDWILSLDADEEVSPPLALEMESLLASTPVADAYFIPRRNLFLGKALRHGGYYPDAKLRLFRRGAALFEERAVHETMKCTGMTGRLDGDIIHHAYPALQQYIEHMNRYSTLGASMTAPNRAVPLLSFISGVLFNPVATFLYNYIMRSGFRDGREGLLLHLYHSCYVSWKYAKAWERFR